jgi:DNA-binding transcriptional LysR family regulator
MGTEADALQVGFALGVTPDKWARIWAERMPRRPLALTPLGGRDGVAMIREGALQMCFVRLPVERDGLHLIPLYVEQPVAVVSKENPVAAYDEIDVADLADEHLLPDGHQDLERTLEKVAADAGIVIVPMSVARLHRRRDVVAVPVTGVPPTRIGLTWPVDADDDRIETFIGIVRGRSANSTRGR